MRNCSLAVRPTQAAWGAQQLGGFKSHLRGMSVALKWVLLTAVLLGSLGSGIMEEE